MFFANVLKEKDPNFFGRFEEYINGGYDLYDSICIFWLNVTYIYITKLYACLHCWLLVVLSSNAFAGYHSFLLGHKLFPFCFIFLKTKSQKAHKFSYILSLCFWSGLKWGELWECIIVHVKFSVHSIYNLK